MDSNPQFRFDISEIPRRWHALRAWFVLRPLTPETRPEFGKILLLTYQGGSGQEMVELLADSLADPDRFLRTCIEEDDWIVPEASKLVDLDGTCIGLYLAGRDPRERGVGAIEQIGVVPEARKQGFGRALHRFAIMDLHDHGYKVYAGGTLSDNLPMLHLFDSLRKELSSITASDHQQG